MSIPAEELARLEQTVTDAHDLAHAHQVLGGYELLDLMLSWAESPALDLITGEYSPPDPWAVELADGYRAAMVAYCRKYQVVFPLPTPTPLTLPERIDAALRKSWRLRATSHRLQKYGQGLRKQRLLG